jgi:multiple sugar transport system substrate-binding protein
VNGITPKAKGEKLEAAAKFLAFITTPDAMLLWMKKVGELPARIALAQSDAVRNDPKYGPFVRGLTYAVATDFVDETAQRQVFIDMVDRIILNHMSAADSLAIAGAAEQKILDTRK